jgi:hypothetical protein
MNVFHRPAQILGSPHAGTDVATKAARSTAETRVDFHSPGRRFVQNE